ncbi:MAG: COX15/CtaA family protein [Halobacteriales archaeon]|nr:COX15/CtaA family protein [Halobacteriales archaeon]
MRFRRLAAGTAVLVGVTMVLGIFTAAAGAGLTCQMRWPLCDGPLGGLFPANWPSFIEWFHRLVAGVTGIPVLATAIQSWRTDQSSRVRYASTAVLVIMPVQVTLGALTVTQYGIAVLFAHFATPVLLFTLSVLTAVWAYEPTVSSGAGRRAALLALPFLALASLLSPRFLVTFTAPIQVVYNGLLLAALAALLAAAVWLDNERGTQFATAGSVLSAAILILGRRTYGDTVVYLIVFSIVVVFGCTVLAARAGDGSEVRRRLTESSQ